MSDLIVICVDLCVVQLTLVEYRDVDFGRTMKITLGSFTKLPEVEINEFPTLKTGSYCFDFLYIHIYNSSLYKCSLLISI